MRAIDVNNLLDGNELAELHQQLMAFNPSASAKNLGEDFIPGKSFTILTCGKVFYTLMLLNSKDNGLWRVIYINR